MSKNSLKTFVTQQLKRAGIEINGNNPWDLQVHDDRFYNKIIRNGSLGLGESYMDKWIDAERLDETVHRLLRANLPENISLNWKMVGLLLRNLIQNRQSKSRSFEVGKAHYDIGNDLFVRMLDKRMAYSCGYWKEATSLDEAQEAKLDLICRKLFLKPGMNVLDIGCGWGSLAQYAAEKYQAHVTGITISKEQVALAKERCKGLPVKIRLQDYREIKGTFDSIVSVGQVEHVGYKNYPTFMKVVYNALKDDGLFLLHTIGNNISTKFVDPWFEKYIFPNGMLPSISQLANASEGLFVMEDWHNFGPDYDKTLMAWNQNFEKHWDHLKERYDERFFRMWRFYLLSCAGSFRARSIQLWQIVFSKKGLPERYPTIR